MKVANPVDLLFEGMEKLGPGDDVDTSKVLNRLPKRSYRTVVDAGCGAGRKTLVLANRLGTLVHAVDSYEPFLASLMRRAKEAGMERHIWAHCMDMADIPHTFRRIDLLWLEGAAYHIGVSHVLKTWHSAIDPEGFVVVSELSWLSEAVPAAVLRFFHTGYPAMRGIDGNRSVAEDAGYRVLDTHTLSDTGLDGGLLRRIEVPCQSVARSSR